ncbi:TadE/TadG family type IV pilus assembly protein [Moritella viscosa]|uniref:TadE/TadG family type IV pilus assembly protein n=1 Tax=Moritella viscosa TaxID=80854 RepID=UPI00094DDB25|nr:TadE family protein [Moritella viscosa]
MRKHQAGSASVEFLFAFMPVFILSMFMIEVCRYMITSSVLDIVFTVATRQVSVVKDDEDIEMRILQHMQDENFKLLKPQMIKLEGRYFKDMKALEAGNGAVLHTKQAFAEYRLSYAYTPLLLPRINVLNNLTFHRIALVAYE